MKKYLFGFLALTAALVSCSDKTVVKSPTSNLSISYKAKSALDLRVDSVMQLMTLKEKIGQMNQYNGFMDFTGPVPDQGDASAKYQDIRDGMVGSMLNVRGVKNVRAVQKVAVEESRLGIPLIFGFDVIHGYQTMGPIPLAEAASWDLEAIQEASRLAAKEAAVAGLNWTFAPNVDISRDARWGRVMEGAGEDPYLGSKIATARVNGFQGEDLADQFTIAACAKHFAAYGFAEAGRDYNTADVGTSTLYNIVLPPFKAAAEAGARTFMNSFNDLNGIPATANEFLLRDILKDQWDYNGFVVSDWGSIKEMIAHNYARDNKDAARLAVNAGSDMDMESYAYKSHLEELVKEGKVDEALIDDAARRILKVKFELGLFDDPYKYCNEQLEKTVTGSDEMMDGALDMALKSMVLLKNDKNILPLKKSGQKIAVLGDLAFDKNSVLGSWRIGAIDNTAVSLVEGFKSYKGNQVTFERGPRFVTEDVAFAMEVQYNETDTTGTAAALKAAKNADVVVMMLGEHGYQSGEGRSRTQLDLPGLQQEFLEQVQAVNEDVVLVVASGRPLVLSWADENVPAILEAWQLGNQSGNAIAQVLYGDYNPSGKLPMSFPVNVGQAPIYYNRKNTGRPVLPGKDVVFWSHYQDAPNDPLYVFGHGLSYTTFEYNDIKLLNDYSSNGKITVMATLKNTGDVAGTEIAQLYIQDEFASVIRPIRELKGFEKITLKPGESKQLSFTLDKDELGFYDNNGNWIVEDGTFNVWIGGSSKTQLGTNFLLIQ
ncbi:beta-glucosidase BglX [Nonlabens ponticola]|uniref:beta-glucosidase n=1 Tax=Nonlabens ponticola TaxID=2496866 RepID=A0A3S9N036_9FLAO|nr:beta-glucosidase BglX [Nonlabens ponticola]AZQ44906.1 beta-glucosidase BglX [Nonlabens ponticola]